MGKFIFISRMCIVATFLSLILSCTCVFGEASSDSLPFRATFLDVGQGLAVLLEYDGRYAMYDMGPDSAGVLDTLVARGVDTLEWVLLSHNHRDHAGGFMELADCGVPSGSARAGGGLSRAGDVPRVYVRRLYVGPDTSGGFIRDSVLRVARGFGIPVDTLVRGAPLGQSSGIGEPCGLSSGDGEAPGFDVLWPPDYVQEGGNPASVVLQVEFGVASLLLTGDLDTAGERRLLELSPTLSAGVLQVPHHGSAGSSSLRFISQVAPEYAVVSVGAGNSYGHPRESVVRKYGYVLGDSSFFFRTDLQGSVEFEMWHHMGALPGRYVDK